jgi:hypothetical protein
MGKGAVVMSRRLQWVARKNFLGFGCSECDWKFCPSGKPTGASLEEMKQWYKTQRDKEFAAHVCANTLTPHRKSAANFKKIA